MMENCFQAQERTRVNIKLLYNLTFQHRIKPQALPCHSAHSGSVEVMFLYFTAMSDRRMNPLEVGTEG